MPTREILEPPLDLGIDRETLAFVVLKARAYDGQVEPDNPDDASSPADDRFVEAIEAGGDSPTDRELRAAIASLNNDAQAALVALAWLGRGDFDGWAEALQTARERVEGPTARYLMGIPLLGDYIEEGAAKVGVNLLEEMEDGLGDPDLDTRGD
ncbi:MAG: DUF3775 domain-containing protein [Vitreimonas sp.]